jgi:hypothetical protein
MKLVTVVAVTSLVLTATAAQAAVLVSMPLSVHPDHSIVCKIANLASQPRQVTIQVINSGGQLAIGLTTPVPAGGTRLISSDEVGTHYCRFTVPGGKNNYRAGAGLYMGTEIFAVPAD